MTVSDVVSKALGVATLAPVPCVADWDSVSYTSRVPHCLRRVDTDLHYPALQNIASANGGTRASGTAGYDKSVDYVVRQLRDAKYNPTVVPFDFDFFDELAPAVLAQTAPRRPPTRPGPSPTPVAGTPPLR